MSLEILEVNHVNVTVPKPVEEQAKHFYGAVLGLEEIPKPGESRKRGGAWYRLGALQIHLSVEDAASNHESKRHVCYSVADVDEAEQEFRRAGVEIIPDNQPVEGCKRFFVRDPGGNRIEITQSI
ncbi:MAG: VOC family protein [Pyrinomonadaceae bacterium]